MNQKIMEERQKKDLALVSKLEKKFNTFGEYFYSSGVKKRGSEKPKKFLHKTDLLKMRKRPKQKKSGFEVWCAYQWAAAWREEDVQNMADSEIDLLKEFMNTKRRIKNRGESLERIRNIQSYIDRTTKESRRFYCDSTLWVDTETTGLDESAEILEISIIDFNNNILLHEQIKPSKVAEWEEASEIHGIYPSDVKDAPTFLDILPKFKKMTGGKILAGYNIPFDLRIINQSSPEHMNFETFCIMRAHAPWFGEYSFYNKSYKWQSLKKACLSLGLDWDSRQAHSSLYDTLKAKEAHEALTKVDNLFIEHYLLGRQIRYCRDVIDWEPIGRFFDEFGNVL